MSGVGRSRSDGLQDTIIPDRGSYRYDGKKAPVRWSVVTRTPQLLAVEAGPPNSPQAKVKWPQLNDGIVGCVSLI